MTAINFEDFKSRVKQVPFGPEAQALKVRELVATRRDCAIDLVFQEMEFGTMIGNLFDWFESAGTEDGKKVDKQTAGALADGIRKVFGKGLTKIACLVLDTAENRKVIGIPENAELVETDYGFDSCPDMMKLIKNSITPRQELLLLEAFIEVNDFVGLVKNYLTRATKMMEGMARATQQKTEEAQPQH